MDLLPLVFTTALVAYALALGSADLPRSVIRVLALLCAAFCLVAWGVAALSYHDWGKPFIDDFYATAVIERRLGNERGGLVLVLAGLLPTCVALFEMWRLKTRRSSSLFHGPGSQGS